MSNVAGAKDRAPRRGNRRSYARSLPLVAAFAAIAAGFFGSTIYGEIRASQIDREAALIETNSLPSVELLVAAQSDLRHLAVATEELAHGSADERRGAENAIADARGDIDREVSAEALTGMYPGEAQLTVAALAAVRDIDALLDRMLELSSSDPSAAKALSEHDVRGAIERADAALDRLLALNAGEAHAEVQRIARVRAESSHLVIGLGALCLLFSAAAAFVAVRALGRQQAVERAHEEVLAERAEELEMFAKRVAHDLLSPLSALSFTLAVVKRNVERGTPIDEPLQRSFACLKRSQRLVDGVLDFARSSASPSSAERASLREAIDGVLDEVRSDEASGASEAELALETWDGDVVVSCSRGILASVLSNLVRNAVKYVGGGGADEKRVTVRVLPADEHVRVEVEDTGPGIPPELAAHVFEPYVRAADNVKPGLGLGLATVRRFVEAHGGIVGVRPASGGGSVFSFELPGVHVRAGEGGLELTGTAIPGGNTVTGG